MWTRFRRSVSRASVLRAVAISCLVAVGWPAVGQDAKRPETGPLHNRKFVATLNGVCGLGAEQEQGCAAIRARELVDASMRPWSAIGRLNYAGVRTRQHCTGTLVAENVVLTAAHCLYNLQRKSWIPATSLRFVAGYQRGETVARAKGTDYILDPVLDIGTRSFRGGFAQDWALVELDSPIGRQAGFLPLLDIRDGSEAMLAGYASLRPHVLSLANDCGTWRLNPLGDLALANCSAMKGDSGAPILVKKDEQYFVAGVHVALLGEAANRLLSAAVPAASFRAQLLD